MGKGLKNFSASSISKFIAEMLSPGSGAQLYMEFHALCPTLQKAYSLVGNLLQSNLNSGKLPFHVKKFDL